MIEMAQENQANSRPVVISTWRHGLAANLLKKHRVVRSPRNMYRFLRVGCCGEGGRSGSAGSLRLTRRRWNDTEFRIGRTMCRGSGNARHDDDPTPRWRIYL